MTPVKPLIYRVKFKGLCFWLVSPQTAKSRQFEGESDGHIPPADFSSKTLSINVGKTSSDWNSATSGGRRPTRALPKSAYPSLG